MSGNFGVQVELFRRSVGNHHQPIGNTAISSRSLPRSSQAGALTTFTFLATEASSYGSRPDVCVRGCNLATTNGCPFTSNTTLRRREQVGRKLIRASVACEVARTTLQTTLRSPGRAFPREIRHPQIHERFWNHWAIQVPDPSTAVRCCQSASLSHQLGLGATYQLEFMTNTAQRWMMVPPDNAVTNEFKHHCVRCCIEAGREEIWRVLGHSERNWAPALKANGTRIANWELQLFPRNPGATYTRGARRWPLGNQANKQQSLSPTAADRCHRHSFIDVPQNSVTDQFRG